MSALHNPRFNAIAYQNLKQIKTAGTERESGNEIKSSESPSLGNSGTLTSHKSSG